MMAAPTDDDGHPIPPPMRIVHKGWFVHHELTHLEAEAYHLREAAKLAGCPTSMNRERQTDHLREAERNRAWGDISQRIPMPLKPVLSAPIKKGT
jgi:hypothetical protein